MVSVLEGGAAGLAGRRHDLNRVSMGSRQATFGARPTWRCAGERERLAGGLAERPGVRQ